MKQAWFIPISQPSPCFVIMIVWPVWPLISTYHTLDKKLQRNHSDIWLYGIMFDSLWISQPIKLINLWSLIICQRWGSSSLLVVQLSCYWCLSVSNRELSSMNRDLRMVIANGSEAILVANDMHWERQATLLAGDGWLRLSYPDCNWVWLFNPGPWSWLLILDVHCHLQWISSTGWALWRINNWRLVVIHNKPSVSAILSVDGRSSHPLVVFAENWRF